MYYKGPWIRLPSNFNPNGRRILPAGSFHSNPMVNSIEKKPANLRTDFRWFDGRHVLRLNEFEVSLLPLQRKGRRYRIGLYVQEGYRISRLWFWQTIWCGVGDGESLL